MHNLLLRKTPAIFLSLLTITLLFVSIGPEYGSAAEEIHHFELTSGLKDTTGMRPKEIIFTAEYPGRIEVEVSWKPGGKKLTVTLYDQAKNPIAGKKEKSPLHLAYVYDKDSFEKSKNLGHSFRVHISQSMLRSISGRVKILTPEKTDIDEEDRDTIRGPYGTFIDEGN